jgi:hypothetical protein
LLIFAAGVRFGFLTAIENAISWYLGITLWSFAASAIAFGEGLLERVKNMGFVNDSKEVRVFGNLLSGAVWTCPGCGGENTYGQTLCYWRKHLVV